MLKELPYDFDLLFNIKSEKELKNQMYNRLEFAIKVMDVYDSNKLKHPNFLLEAVKNKIIYINGDGTYVTHKPKKEELKNYKRAIIM